MQLTHLIYKHVSHGVEGGIRFESSEQDSRRAEQQLRAAAHLGFEADGITDCLTTLPHPANATWLHPPATSQHLLAALLSYSVRHRHC